MSANRYFETVTQGVVCGSTSEYATFYTPEFFKINYYYPPPGQRKRLTLDLANWYKLLVTRNNTGKYYVSDYELPDKAENRDPTKVDVFVLDIHKYNCLKEWTCSLYQSLRYKSRFFVDSGETNVVKESFLGPVKIDSHELRQLKDRGITEFDAHAELLPNPPNYAEPDRKPHFKIADYFFEGKEFSLNGYLSKMGKVMRGPKGVLLKREDAVVPPDTLRPKSQKPSRFASIHEPKEETRIAYDNGTQKSREMRQENQYLAAMQTGMMRKTDLSLNETLSLVDAQPSSATSTSNINTDSSHALNNSSDALNQSFIERSSMLSDTSLYSGSRPLASSTPIVTDDEDNGDTQNRNLDDLNRTFTEQLKYSFSDSDNLTISRKAPADSTQLAAKMQHLSIQGKDQDVTFNVTGDQLPSSFMSSRSTSTLFPNSSLTSKKSMQPMSQTSFNTSSGNSVFGFDQPQSTSLSIKPSDSSLITSGCDSLTSQSRLSSSVQSLPSAQRSSKYKKKIINMFPELKNRN